MDKGFRFVAKLKQFGDSTMKHYLAAVFALCIFTLLGPSTAPAQTRGKMVI